MILTKTLTKQADARSLSSLIRATPGLMMNGEINPLTKRPAPDFLNRDADMPCSHDSKFEIFIKNKNYLARGPNTIWPPDLDDQKMEHFGGMTPREIRDLPQEEINEWLSSAGHPDLVGPPQLRLATFNGKTLT